MSKKDHHDKHDKKKDKKQKIRDRNRKYNLINLQAEVHEEHREKAMKDSGLFIDTDRIGEKDRERRSLVDATDRISIMRAKLEKSRQQAAKKWSVAATSGGSFMMR